MAKQEAAGPDRAAVRVVLRFYQAFNGRDMRTIMSLLDDKHIDHTYFGRDPVTPQALARAFRGMLDVFPDWHETVDEIVPGEGGTIVVRATGRGTQRKEYMGKQPTGKQIAVPLINVLKVRGGKITEYRSTFPFTTPDQEDIVAAEDVQEVRAEQGGFRISEGNWMNVLEDYADGRIDINAALSRKGEVPEERARCQTLLADNMRRCLNPAAAGSIYCTEHQDAGSGGGFGLD